MATRIEPFWLARRVSAHVAIHPVDQELHPPDGYLYIHDALVIGAGLFWALGYLFASIRCVRDKAPGIPLYCMQVEKVKRTCSLGADTV